MPPAGGRLLTIDRAPTVLDLIAHAQTVDDVVGVICAAARARTWPFEIRRALETVPRVRHRALLLDLLADVAGGVESPLERRYRPCEVAVQVEAALVSRGWTGRARPCGPACAVG